MSSLRYNYPLEDERYRITPAKIASLDICVQIITKVRQYSVLRDKANAHEEIMYSFWQSVVLFFS